jgi:hypothetical protein
MTRHFYSFSSTFMKNTSKYSSTSASFTRGRHIPIALIKRIVHSLRYLSCARIPSRFELRSKGDSWCQGGKGLPVFDNMYTKI